MSDLYLVLRHRLDEVSTEWVAISSAVLKRARKRKGYSYETLARQLPVAAKTWERYEKAGRIPRSLLNRVAELLDLEIEQAEPQRVAVASPAAPPVDEQPSNAELRVELRAIRQLLERLVDRLDREQPQAGSSTP